MSLFLYAIFVIMLNLLMPVYTNGVTWSYNFIPSIVAAAILYFLFLEALWGWWKITKYDYNRKFIIHSVIFIALVFQALIPQSVDAFLNYNARQVAKREVNTIAPDDYLLDKFFQDKIYPNSFTYLAEFPFSLPIKARQWNYHFMLVLDANFWNDCHALGLGPEPRKEWLKFYKSPPDVLVFDNRLDIMNFVLALNKCQGVSTSGLLDEIKKRYVRVSRQGGALYILQRHIPEFLALGWKISDTNIDL